MLAGEILRPETTIVAPAGTTAGSEAMDSTKVPSELLEVVETVTRPVTPNVPETIKPLFA